MYIPEVTIEKVVSAVFTLKVREGDVVMVSLCEKAGLDLDALVHALNIIGVPFFGGIFPGIIGEGEKKENGALVKIIPAKTKPLIYRGITDKKFENPECLSQMSDDSYGDAILLVDGLSDNISSFLSSIFNLLGNRVKYIGGGAGSLSFVKQPCLFTNEGALQDAAILLLTSKTISTGVKHGWEKVSGPFVATQTSKTKIEEINWQNAFEVYKQVVEEDSQQTLTVENFFDIAKGYPFGIKRAESEYVVRDPISTDEDGSLLCVGEVSENVVIDILKGSTENLIEAAHEAVEIATKDADFSQTFIVDCISRALFLDDDYSRSLDLIKEHIDEQKEGVSVEGMLTIGEISTYGRGYLEFLNKTIVVGLM